MVFIPVMQGKLNKSTNALYHMNKMKTKNMIISTDSEKVSDTIQHPFMIKKKKPLNKLVKREHILA